MTTISDVSTTRKYVLRAFYVFMSFGLGSIIWPLMFNHPQWTNMHSVACALLAALSVMAFMGIRYPLQMLPVILFEFLWKVIWVSMIAYPAWRTGQLSAENVRTFYECLMGVVLCPLVIPWKYVWSNYVVKSAEPLRGADPARGVSAVMATQTP